MLTLEQRIKTIEEAVGTDSHSILIAIACIKKIVDQSRDKALDESVEWEHRSLDPSEQFRDLSIRHSEEMYREFENLSLVSSELKILMGKMHFKF